MSEVILTESPDWSAIEKETGPATAAALWLIWLVLQELRQRRAP